MHLNLATNPGPRASPPYFPRPDAQLRVIAADGTTSSRDLVLGDRAYGHYTDVSAAVAALGRASAGEGRAALALVRLPDGGVAGHSIRATWNEGPDTWRTRYGRVTIEGAAAARVGQLLVSADSDILGLLDGATFVAAQLER